LRPAALRQPGAPARERAVYELELPASLYPRSALLTSPDRASFDNVVLTLARPSPVAAATSPAVIALPPLRASRTALRVAPDAARARGAPVALAERARARGLAAVAVAVELLDVDPERDADFVVEAG